MPYQENNENQALVAVLIFIVLGIAFLYAGYIWGIILIGLGILLAFGIFPQLREITLSIIIGIIEFFTKNHDGTQTTTAPQSSPVQTPVIEKPSTSSYNVPASVEEINSWIKDFQPHRMPHSEREVELMLLQHLRTHTNSLRTQLQYERTQIDAQIGTVGIEIKFQPPESELDRLYGQIEKYLRHLDYVIAVIGYERSPESTREFRKRLARSGWRESVFVISIPYLRENDLDYDL